MLLHQLLGGTQNPAVPTGVLPESYSSATPGIHYGITINDVTTLKSEGELLEGQQMWSSQCDPDKSARTGGQIFNVE